MTTTTYMPTTSYLLSIICQTDASKLAYYVVLYIIKVDTSLVKVDYTIGELGESDDYCMVTLH